MSYIASVASPLRIQLVESPVSIRLTDGTAVVFRPLQRRDVRRVLEMHDRLSADSTFFRYLHPYKPTFEEVDSLAQLASKDGAAIVAVVEGPGEERMVGLGFYRIDANDKTIAQPAFLVEDEFQNRGLGRALARLIVQHAKLNGVRALDGHIHPANGRMMHLIQASGLSYTAKLGYGACEVRVALEEI